MVGAGSRHIFNLSMAYRSLTPHRIHSGGCARSIQMLLNPFAHFSPQVPDLLRKDVLAKVSVLLAWLAIVVFQMQTHTMWRDEVRALSMALDGNTVFDMIRTLHGEGHPAIWYLLLHAFYMLTGSVEVLPAVAFVVAACTMAILVLYSPFPRLVIWGLVLGSLLNYEYVVMARNYGISVLLMFLLAVVWKTQRGGRFLPGFLLLLLANTNVIGAMMVGAFLLFWLAELWDEQGLAWNSRSRAFAMNAALATIGVILCGVTILPTFNDAATRDLANASPVWVAVKALVNPAATSLSTLTGVAIPNIASNLLLFALPVGLVARRSAFLSALAALAVSSLFFAIAAPGAQRHAGIFFFYCVTLYWISWEDIRRALSSSANNKIIRLLTQAGLVGCVVLVELMAAIGIYQAVGRIARITPVESRSADLGRLITSREDLTHATILADPDYMVEALPYYIDNPLYLLRSHRIGRIVIFSRAGQLTATLGEILDAGRELRKASGRPVVILLAHRLDQIVPGQVYKEGYNWSFRASAEEIKNFTLSAKLLARFDPASTDETYDVYVLE